MNNLGERLIYIRESLALKKDHVMKLLGISNLGRFENNERSPSIETLIALAQFYNVSIDWLLLGNGEMLQQKQPQPLPLVMDFEIDELDAEQKELLFLFAHLGDTGKYAVKDFARYQLETLPRNAPNERPKGAGKLSCFRPFSDPQNGVNSA